jgi:hypothetical protein
MKMCGCADVRMCECVDVRMCGCCNVMMCRCVNVTILESYLCSICDITTIPTTVNRKP